jgi:DNA-binding response OmpR family regulator
MQKRILLSLAEPSLSQVYTRFMARRGFIPFYFPDPIPAAIFFETLVERGTLINLALLDFDLPNQAAFKSVARMGLINRRAVRPATFLGMTGNPSIGERDGASLGIQKIVPKPIDPSDLLALLDEQFAG